ncbi:MAG: type II secretion system protein, partial [Candidatus Eremiobacteraeota bacterium]|nr:type II secretion system protein [Candidatus Eremiobacteraeota bacterium]
MRTRGFTLLEVILGTALLGMLMVFLAAILMGSQKVWRQVSGSTESGSQLLKALREVRGEMVLASPRQITTVQVPASLGGGPDGDAVWFTSAIDPNTGEFVRKPNGSPFWQRNVLYYLVVPTNHDNLFGASCAGGVGPDGYDDTCPHKVLIRKEIDFGPATDTTNEANEETLMTPAEIGPYLTRPNGYSVTTFAGEQAQIKARELLGFRVMLNPLPATIEVRGVNLPRANKSLAVGTVSL